MHTSEPFLLYHWSPTVRRRRITHDGLRPSCPSVGREWKPPYVCFSTSPSLAWALSGHFHPDVPTWDLWMVWSNVPSGYEVLFFDDGSPKEYRIYERLYKRDIWYVGSRGQGQ